MRRLSRLAALAACALAAAVAPAFDTVAPEAAGLPSSAVLDWLNAVERDVDALHSFVLLRHGRLVAEGWWAPYERDRPHMLYSLSKSFTSTAVGIAADEGRLSLDAPVASFFPDKLPAEPSANLRAMRVRDLLRMGTGHSACTFGPMKASGDPDWTKLFFAQPVEHAPGTHFCYNTGATYMLAAILQKTTGQSLTEYLGPRLFEPLGIRGAAWETSPQGVQTGGYGLKVKTRDIAALGQLYLQRGLWNDKRLLSESWVQAATSRQIDNGSKPESDWCQGYGFQFWRCRHNVFRGDGAFGQYCIVMPDQDAVLAITSGLADMQKVLDLVWARLLPRLGPAPLPPDPAAREALASKLASLTLPAATGARVPEPGPGASAYGQTFTFDDNEKGLRSLALGRDGQGDFLALCNAHGTQRVACGYGRWAAGELTFELPLVLPLGTTNGRQPVAASGAWAAPDLYVVHLYFRETPYRLTLSLRFKDERLYLDLEYNVAFGPQRKWSLLGRPADRAPATPTGAAAP